MSGSEQSGAPSLTRSDFAVSVAAPNGIEGANGTPAARAESEPPDAVRAESSRAGLPSSVIHELRTPLTSIHGYAQVLQRTLRDEPRAKNALAVVVRETTRLSAMLSELSELSELEAGDIIVTPIELEVHQIVDGVVHEIIRRDAGDHPIAFTGTAIARCNPTIMSQVLLHVLTNAVRFSISGSPIEVAVASPGDTVEITVSDRGISVDPADAERIYQAYERGANARAAGVRGLGLGLFLSRRALARAGGTIDHWPRDGGGTVFRITIPGA
jgi:signal transduction histidine kinase